jgi:hypothetical protein
VGNSQLLDSGSASGNLFKSAQADGSNRDENSPGPSIEALNDKDTKAENLGGIIFSAFAGGGLENNEAEDDNLSSSAGSTDSVISPDVGELGVEEPVASANRNPATVKIKITTAGPPASGIANGKAVSSRATVGESNVSEILAKGSPVTPNTAIITVGGKPVFVEIIDTQPAGNVYDEILLQQDIEVEIGGKTFAVNPSAKGITLAGIEINPGGPRPTILGTPVSLALSSVLMIGTLRVPLAATGPSEPSIYTLGGQAFSANSDEVVIAGTTLKPGGPGITISGTLVLLVPSGILIIGTSRVSLTPLTSEPKAVTYTVGDNAFIANPSEMLIAGTKLTPGGPGVAISGTLISLARGGTLVIESSIIHLHTTTNPRSTSVSSGKKYTAKTPSAASATGTLARLAPPRNSGVGESNGSISPSSPGNQASPTKESGGSNSLGIPALWQLVGGLILGMGIEMLRRL